MIIYDFIKALSLSFFTCLIYFRLTNKIAYSANKRMFFLFCYTLIPLIIPIWLYSIIIEPLKSILFIFILGFLIHKLEWQAYFRGVAYAAVSYAISIIFYFISSVITSLFFASILKIYEINIYLFLLVFIIEAVLVYILYKMKFRMWSNINRTITNIGVTATGIIVILYAFYRKGNMGTHEFVLLFSGIGVCILSAGMWIKQEKMSNFTKNAIEQLLRQWNMELELIESENLFLQKTAHTNSKKFLAYRDAVIYTAFTSTNPYHQRKAMDLLHEFDGDNNDVYEEIILEIQSRKELPSTGMLVIDAIYSFYCGEAAKCDIDFDLFIDGDPKRILRYVNQSKLETIVSNLLDNAVNAVRKQGNCEQSGKKIIARIWASKGRYGVSVDDNGVAFVGSVLSDLERCKKTLIPDEDNGGGIGFVTIFEITNTCNASMIISDSNGFKSISIQFDGKNKINVGDYKN